MAGREGKRAFICISSSSEEEEEEDDDNDQVEDSGTEEEEDDGDEGDDDDYNDEQEDDDADEQIEEGDDEALCNKVIRSLKGSSFFLFSLTNFLDFSISTRISLSPMSMLLSIADNSK